VFFCHFFGEGNLGLYSASSDHSVYGSPHSRDSYHLHIPNICVDAGRFGCGPEAVWRIHVLRYIMARCGKIGGCRVGVPRRVEL